MSTISDIINEGNEPFETHSEEYRLPYARSTGEENDLAETLHNLHVETNGDITM